MSSLLDLPHRRCREALATGAPVFVPVNPIEYHGPHLPLHNDRLIAAGLIRDLHARLQQQHPDWPLLTVDDLELGVDPVPGPGTREFPLPLVARAVRTSCEALARLGARRVVLMTFHGGPRHSLALEAGVRCLLRLGVEVVNPFNAVLHRMVRGTSEAETARIRQAAMSVDQGLGEVLDEIQFDYHAGLLETSLTLHYAPDSVDPGYRQLPPCPPVSQVRMVRLASRLAGSLGASGLAQELSFAALGMGWYRLKPFPGYTGAPHRASAPLGARLAELLVELLEQATLDVFQGRKPSPPPIMAWIGPLTLGGRISTAQNKTG